MVNERTFPYGKYALLENGMDLYVKLLNCDNITLTALPTATITSCNQQPRRITPLIKSIPQEILKQIFKKFKSKKEISNLNLVSKHFFNCSVDSLYRNVEIKGTKGLYLFTKSMIINEKYRKNINPRWHNNSGILNNFALSFYSQNESESVLAMYMIPFLENVQILSFTNITVTYSDLFKIFSVCKNLTSLSTINLTGEVDLNNESSFEVIKEGFSRLKFAKFLDKNNVEENYYSLFDDDDQEDVSNKTLSTLLKQCKFNSLEALTITSYRNESSILDSLLENKVSKNFLNLKEFSLESDLEIFNKNQAVIELLKCAVNLKKLNFKIMKNTKMKTLSHLVPELICLTKLNSFEVTFSNMENFDSFKTFFSSKGNYLKYLKITMDSPIDKDMLEFIKLTCKNLEGFFYLTDYHGYVNDESWNPAKHPIQIVTAFASAFGNLKYIGNVQGDVDDAYHNELENIFVKDLNLITIRCKDWKF
ncbi:hypothetical protein HK099_000044 [Clydaea vesicula]|uniref:F-box domain-containing protein n=1 Tax=Clydaea vesicula TaxID=447962 RepID=A0AAD5UCG0_9FUNG|nr:hypothetical protein HK099_000044 [Clydaea vesicula]